MNDRHRRQGFSLLATGLLVSLTLVWFTTFIGGMTLFSPVAFGLAGVLAAIGLGVGALWHARRYGWAWGLLLGVPGVALAALVGFFVLFAIGIS